MLAVLLVGVAVAALAVVAATWGGPKPPKNAPASTSPPPEEPPVAAPSPLPAPHPTPDPLRERKLRLNALLEEVRKIREADPTFARRADVLTRFGAALDVADGRRPEVELLRNDYEKALNAYLAATAPPETKPRPAEPAPPPPNARPTVKLISPPGGATYVAPARIPLAAEAFDPEGKPLTVEFFDGPRKLGDATRFPFEFVWSDVPAGTYTLTAKATDEAGAFALSAPLPVTVAPPPPPPPPEVKKVEPEPPKREKVPTAKELLEEFNLRLKDSKTVDEKALAIQALGWAEPKDPGMIAPLVRFLAPHPTDINFLLPRTALDALSRFRGDRAASQALQQAAESYRRVAYPGLRAHALYCLAGVGHESALPVFEDPLRAVGEDYNAARYWLNLMRRFPPVLGLESLFRVWDDHQKQNAASCPQTVQDEMVIFAQAMSGESYKSMTELRHWWKLRGEAFKQKLGKEKEARPAAGPAPATLPYSLLVEFMFEEEAGAFVGNTGTSAAWFPQARLTAARPSRATGPPGKCLDWGTAPGPHAVDLIGMIPHLKDLKSFTIMGWFLPRGATEGRGGNRLLTWLKPGQDGVELVWRSDGSLQLGVNEAADASAARSTAGHAPALANEKAAPTEIDRAWRSFAVTYDSTAASGHVKFYFVAYGGSEVKMVAAKDYAKGPVGSYIAANLAVGNVLLSARASGADRMFRGSIDQIRIFGSTVDGAGALSLTDVQSYYR